MLYLSRGRMLLSRRGLVFGFTMMNPTKIFVCIFKGSFIISLSEKHISTKDCSPWHFKSWGELLQVRN